MSKTRAIVFLSSFFIGFIVLLTAIQLPQFIKKNAQERATDRLKVIDKTATSEKALKNALNNRLVVKLKKNTTTPLKILTKAGLNNSYKLQSTEIPLLHFPSKDIGTYFRLTVPNSKDMSKTIAVLKKDNNVEYVEPDYIVTSENHIKDEFFLDPNPPAEIRGLANGSGKWDPWFDIQWNLKKISFPHNLPIVNPSVIIAVIDTGVDYTHPELIDHMWKNPNEIAGNGVDDDRNGYIDDVSGWDAVAYDFVPEDATDPNIRFIKKPDNDPMDDPREDFFTYYYSSKVVAGGHGTHVAGIASANSNNNGMIGVNPGATIMPLRVLNAKGIGYASDIAEMINYAASNKAKVINMSLGTKEHSKILYDAIKFASDLGVVIITANENLATDFNMTYPANYEEVMAVSSIDSSNRKVNYNNEKTDIAAPGDQIIAPRAKGTDSACIHDAGCLGGRKKETEYVVGKNNDYYIMSGTSMATPHVSALASLVITKWPNYTADEVKQAIYRNVDYVVPAPEGISTHFGVINVDRTLNNPKPLPTQYPSFKNWKLSFVPSCANGNVLWEQRTYLSLKTEKILNNGKKSSDGRVLSKKVLEEKTFNITSPDIDTPIMISMWTGYDGKLTRSNTAALPHKNMIFDRFDESVIWNAQDLPSGEYEFKYKIDDPIACNPLKWNITAEIICKNNRMSELLETQMIYMIWPPGKQKWQTLPFNKVLSHEFDITTVAPFSKIYIAMKSNDGVFLQPHNKVIRDKESLSKGIEYVTFSNFGSNKKYPVIDWYINDTLEKRARFADAVQKDGYIEKFTFQFYAPDEWCQRL